MGSPFISPFFGRQPGVMMPGMGMMGGGPRPSGTLGLAQRIAPFVGGGGKGGFGFPMFGLGPGTSMDMIFGPDFSGFGRLEDSLRYTPYGFAFDPSLLNQGGFNQLLGSVSGGVMGKPLA